MTSLAEAAETIRCARRLLPRLDKLPKPPHLAETYELNRAKVLQADDALARSELGFLPLIPLGLLIAGGLAGAYGVYRVGKAVLDKVDVAIDVVGQEAINLSRVLVWVVGGAAAAFLVSGTQKRIA